MSLKNRNLVTIDDLSNDEMESIFCLADEMADSTAEQYGLCQGKIMATLFFEPSTRTRLSFEAAMLRLGGRVISTVDVGATSLAKGESIADMARVVGSYADIIVMRHPWEGAAKVVADYAGIPVVNAGDGGHEHPTQTLLDLYTIRKERQTLSGLRIALWGDLKHGRTIHSLIYALARLGASILFCPGSGLELPEHVMRRLNTEYRGQLKKSDHLNHGPDGKLFPIDAMYITPTSHHQLAMLTDVSLNVELKAGVDALYVTRLQKERQAPTTDQQEPVKYPVVDKELLKGKGFEKTLVMHPLPRVDELAYEVDSDPRSSYFKQAAHGIPVRMALTAMLLGARDVSASTRYPSFAHKVEYPTYRRDSGVRCPNKKCVTNQSTETKYIKPEFRIISSDPLTLRCIYCEHELYPEYVASSDWHQGTLDHKKYHSARSRWTKKIKPENLIIFTTEDEARAWQVKSSGSTRE